MGSQERYPELSEGRCSERRQDDIRRGGGQTHAQYDRSQSRETERDKEMAARQGDDELRHPQPDTGERCHADHDPGRCAGGGNLHRSRAGRQDHPTRS